MKDALDALVSEIKQDLQSVHTDEAFERVRVAYVGRKGKLSEILSGLKDLPDEERKQIGQHANAAKIAIEASLAQTQERLQSERLGRLHEEEWVDLTLPGVFPKEGHLHIVSQTIAEVEGIFSQIGFTRHSVPEVDWDYYAFEALNMPKDHPARDEWETYFLDIPIDKKMGKMVATPHPSNDQVRLMEKLEPPFRALYIGKAYRRQSDVSHVPIHHQFEVEVISKDATLSQLRGVIEHFVHEYFGYERDVRLRPHHFRFTEPSFEVDISCAVCGGKGCRFCKEGWVELAGAGLTHPNVIKAGGLDPEEWKGFAFAFGVERVLMMREGIQLPDMRDLYRNDLRFLKQF